MRRKNKLFLLLILFLSIANISYSSSSILISPDNRIVAYKDVNALKLTLSDGQILSYSSLTKNVSQEITENIDPVEIVFILDCSGSMNRTTGTSSRIDQLKVASIALLEKLYTLLPSDKLSVALIPFSSGVLTDQILDLTNNLPIITQKIQNLEAGGGTQISEAILQGSSKFTNSSNTKKILITITDGSVGDKSETTTALTQVKNQGIVINSIFIELAPETCFTSVVPTENVFAINSSSGDTIYDTVVNTLYESLYSELIEIVEKTSTEESYNATLLPNELVLITLDDELIHGATLEIEYIITILLQTDCKSLYIRDNLTPNLVYSENKKLLTENKINADYNWTYNNQTLTYSNINPDQLKKGSVITQKVILSKTLSVQEDSDYQFDNSAYIYINRADDETFTGTTHALRVLILPPFGKQTTPILNILPLLSISAIYIKIKEKLNRKSK